MQSDTGMTDKEMYDDCFYVSQSRFGLWNSFRASNDEPLLTGGTKEGVVTMTSWHLKCEQEGWPEGSVRVINNGIVGGKL